MNLDLEGINNLIQEYEKDTKAIREELFRICWYMRGSLSFTEAFLLTPEDKEIITSIIEGNLTATKDSGLPFF